MSHKYEGLLHIFAKSVLKLRNVASVYLVSPIRYPRTRRSKVGRLWKLTDPAVDISLLYFNKVDRLFFAADPVRQLGNERETRVFLVGAFISVKALITGVPHL